MHAGADRCDAGGQERAGGLADRLSRERPELGRVAERAESPWPGSGAGTGDRRRGWKALDEVWPTCRHQRCRVHKTSNVLNKLAKSARKTAKADLRAIWMAESRADAARAMGVCAARYQAKHPKAVECLTRDRAELLAFYDFPAEHWQHLRTTNPIESVFATVRHRTVRSCAFRSKTASSIGPQTRRVTLTGVIFAPFVKERRMPRERLPMRKIRDALRSSA